MTGEILARRYAQALADLSYEEGVHVKVRDQLAAFVKSAYDGGAIGVFLDPSLGLDQKSGLVDEIAKSCGMEKVLVNFIKLLVEKKRIAEVASIAEAFQQIVDDKMGCVRAQVMVSSECEEKEIEAVRSALEKVSGKKVVLDVEVDAALLGGVVARVGSTVYDGSVRTQLENIKNNIMRG